MEEIWKDVQNYEGLYQVSNFGRVKSFHYGNGRLRSNIPKGNQGYYFVCLSKNGCNLNHYVHRLVATAFVPNVNNKPHVNHIDANKGNNHFSNLEWVTHAENLQKAGRYGTGRMPIGKTHFHSKSIYQFTLGGQLVKIHYSVREAELETGFYRIKLNKCAKDNGLSNIGFGYRWSYTDNVSLDFKYELSCKKPVHKFDMNGNFVHFYESLADAAKSINGHVSGIRMCINGKIKQTGGFKWKYA